MSFALEFHDNGVFLVFADVVTDEQLLESDEGLYRHTYPEGLQFQLVDLSDVRDFQASHKTMRYLGEKDREFSQANGRQLIVVVAPTHGRANSIVWEVWAQDTSAEDPVLLTKIVDTHDEAFAWLKENGIEIT
ncbi:hypothetical protein Pan97_14710 [Bremerella volcania]|uniref:STAS/SEC14 domain-containing protein n=1 Tax=Bremerella volcania TaxID=2527984 RepID=A0A518C5G0_9BACT|nr:hypothetical protein [Bremerella volcania]QDU74463.1 hypothetical protein Pan97_14710 [Bremerella volcania]